MKRMKFKDESLEAEYHVLSEFKEVLSMDMWRAKTDMTREVVLGAAYLAKQITLVKGLQVDLLMSRRVSTTEELVIHLVSKLEKESQPGMTFLEFSEKIYKDIHDNTVEEHLMNITEESKTYN